jgi:hypothetical protein
MYIRWQAEEWVLSSRAFGISDSHKLLAFLSIGILLAGPFVLFDARSAYATDDEDCMKEFDIEDCPDQNQLIFGDRHPPKITAPPDIRVVAEEEPIFIDIGKPKVFDLVDASPVITNDAPKGHLFEFGTTIVQWKATDMNGNSAVDYQFVTIVKHPSPTLPFKPIEGVKKSMASLKLDPLPDGIRAGEKVLLSGKLIDSNTGIGVQGVNVRILDNRPLDQRALGVAKTDDEGKFSFTWYTSPTERGKDRLMSIIAKFDGTSAYASTVSSDRSLAIEVERITLDLFYKKQDFGSGERVIVLGVFRTFGDKLIDPDEMEARFDGKEVSMIRKAAGIYEFMSLANAKPAHLFVVKGIKLPEADLPFGSVVKSIRVI